MWPRLRKEAEQLTHTHTQTHTHTHTDIGHSWLKDGNERGITWGEGLRQRLGLGRGWGRLASMNEGIGVEGGNLVRAGLRMGRPDWHEWGKLGRQFDQDQGQADKLSIYLG